MNGVEINTRAYVATRLLLRWDYLYAVTLKTKVFGDYNHARLEVSWTTSTRGLLLRGYTGVRSCQFCGTCCSNVDHQNCVTRCRAQLLSVVITLFVTVLLLPFPYLFIYLLFFFFLLIFEGFPNRVLVYPDRGGLQIKLMICTNKLCQCW